MGKNIKMAYYGIVVALTVWYVARISGDPQGASGMGLMLSYVLGAVAVLGTVVSSLLFVVNSPKNAKKLLIGLAALIVIGGIAYTFGSGEVTEFSKYHGVETESQSKWIDMGMYLTVFLGFGAVALTLITEAIGLFKN